MVFVLTFCKENSFMYSSKQLAISTKRATASPQRQLSLSPGVLCPDGESSVMERRGTDGAYPAEGHKSKPRDRTPFLQGQANRDGAIQPKEEKAPQRPDRGLPVSKERPEERRKQTLLQHLL